MAETPIYIENIPADIIAQIVDHYATLTGRVIYPAQVERLLMNAFAYRESLVRQAIQDAATQNLVAFSRAPILDYLGELVGVKRVGALPATCTIQFTLPANPSGVTVPEGTRIRSIDGRVVFVTDEDLNIAEDVLTSTVTATCEVDGEEGNGYLMNQVNTIVDPLPFIATANNLQTTAGGSAQESDANLRERIRLAPSSFSNAGSSGAYKFFAKTANPNIVDVFVTSTVPGTVTIYPLMADGEETPEQVITAVEEACNDEKVRPLTDTVEVISPTKEEYVLNIELTLYEEADQASIEELVLANLEAYTLSKRTALGQDVVLSQIQKQCMVDGVYDVVVKDGDDDPFVTLVIDAESFAFCTEINIQTVGTNVG